MNKLTTILLLLLLSNQAVASNMGNGPAMLAVWAIGLFTAFLLSIAVASKEDAKLDKNKFFKTFISTLFVFFILGIFMAFWAA